MHLRQGGYVCSCIGLFAWLLAILWKICTTVDDFFIQRTNEDGILSQKQILKSKKIIFYYNEWMFLQDSVAISQQQDNSGQFVAVQVDYALKEVCAFSSS